MSNFVVNTVLKTPLDGLACTSASTVMAKFNLVHENWRLWLILKLQRAVCQYQLGYIWNMIYAIMLVYSYGKKIK